MCLREVMEMKKNKKRNSNYNYNHYNNHYEVISTNHAYDQLCRRFMPLPKVKMTRKVQNYINHGRLLSLSKSDENYSYNGLVFCCAPDTNNGKKVIIVKTVKLTSTRRRTHFSPDLSHEKVDKKKLGMAV